MTTEYRNNVSCQKTSMFLGLEPLWRTPRRQGRFVPAAAHRIPRKEKAAACAAKHTFFEDAI
jgi:hypothetical protein